MLTVQKINRLVNGETEVSLRMSSEEAHLLLTYALNDLVSKGFAKVEEINEGQLDLFSAEVGGSA